MDCKAVTCGARSTLDADAAPAHHHPAMATVTASLRRSSGLLSIALSFLLVLTGVVGALHHHGDSAAGHACAVCTASHAPAVTTLPAAGSPTPSLLPGRVDASRAEHPPQIRVVAIAARAPPPA